MKALFSLLLFATIINSMEKEYLNKKFEVLAVSNYPLLDKSVDKDNNDNSSGSDTEPDCIAQNILRYQAKRKFVKNDSDTEPDEYVGLSNPIADGGMHNSDTDYDDIIVAFARSHRDVIYFPTHIALYEGQQTKAPWKILKRRIIASRKRAAKQ